MPTIFLRKGHDFNMAGHLAVKKTNFYKRNAWIMFRVSASRGTFVKGPKMEHKDFIEVHDNL